MTIPNGLSEIIAMYGDPKFNGVMVDPKWESDNMIVVRDLPMVAKLYVHRLIADPLRKALAECAALPLSYGVRTIGCFAPRLQRGSNTLLSVHTFGAAIDLNADQNRLIICDQDDPRRSDPASCDIPRQWIDAFKAQGFFWGGDFKHRFDPMHFQLATGY